MAQPKVSMAVRSINGAAVIDIKGEITGFAENTLMDAYTEAVSTGAKSILLNFSDLDYMNSSGIGLLVTLLIRTQRQKQQLFAFGLNDHYRQIFEITRLNEAIKVFPTEIEAISSAN